jgi:hypothetical protein
MRITKDTKGVQLIKSPNFVIFVSFVVKAKFSQKGKR